MISRRRKRAKSSSATESESDEVVDNSDTKITATPKGVKKKGKRKVDYTAEDSEDEIEIETKTTKVERNTPRKRSTPRRKVKEVVEIDGESESLLGNDNNDSESSARKKSAGRDESETISTDQSIIILSPKSPSRPGRRYSGRNTKIRKSPTATNVNKRSRRK